MVFVALLPTVVVEEKKFLKDFFILEPRPLAVKHTFAKGSSPALLDSDDIGGTFDGALRRYPKLFYISSAQSP